ncbi:MAG: hypothetical protein ABT940_07565 [Alphaproteobacteria bacterium]
MPTVRGDSSPRAPHSFPTFQGIGNTIGTISDLSAGIASSVDQQSAATREIARNVEQAAGGTQDVSRNIAGVTQAAGQAGDSARVVQTSAEELSQQAVRLRTEVDQFIARIRKG